MSMGMSYDVFWNGDPYIAVFYRNAHIERQKAENTSAWLLGQYVKSAIISSLDKKHKYPKKPLELSICNDFEQEHKQRLEKEKAIQQFKVWAELWSKNNG